jgi:hypothetical protein
VRTEAPVAVIVQEKKRPSVERKSFLKCGKIEKERMKRVPVIGVASSVLFLCLTDAWVSTPNAARKCLAASRKNLRPVPAQQAKRTKADSTDISTEKPNGAPVSEQQDKPNGALEAVDPPVKASATLGKEEHVRAAKAKDNASELVKQEKKSHDENLMRIALELAQSAYVSRSFFVFLRNFVVLNIITDFSFFAIFHIASH